MNPSDTPSSPSASGETSSGSDLRSNVQNDVSTATEAAKQDLHAIADKAAEELRSVKDLAAEQVRSVKDMATEQVSAATDKAKSFAGDQKNLIAGQVTGIADAIDKVAGELEQSDNATVARYARDIAGGLSRIGKDVEGKEVDELLGMAQSFGRQQPLAFLGAAALAGFVASRFALSSTHRSQNTATSGNQGSTGDGYRPSGSTGYNPSSYASGDSSYSAGGSSAAARSTGTPSAASGSSSASYNAPSTSSPSSSYTSGSSTDFGGDK